VNGEADYKFVIIDAVVLVIDFTVVDVSILSMYNGDWIKRCMKSISAICMLLGTHVADLNSGIYYCLATSCIADAPVSMRISLAFVVDVSFRSMYNGGWIKRYMKFISAICMPFCVHIAKVRA